MRSRYAGLSNAHRPPVMWDSGEPDKAAQARDWDMLYYRSSGRCPEWLIFLLVILVVLVVMA